MIDTEDEERNHMNECYRCIHRSEIQGSVHSKCMNPSQSVAHNGDEYGKKNGWFSYPYSFDPTWKGKELCQNFKEKEGEE